MTEQQTNYETGEILTAAPQVDPKTQAKLYAKLARVMGKMERIEKRGWNDFHNYEYVEDADVLDAVRQALADEKIAFFASMVDVQQEAIQDDKGKTTIKTRPVFHYTFACGETGATYTCRWVGEANDKQDKGTSKAATLSLKYFLLKDFLMSTGDPTDDPDSDGGTPAPAKRASKPRASGGNGKKPVVEEPMTLFWATGQRT
jgi:hypothetical protein